jgi:hypothetical protein
VALENLDEAVWFQDLQHDGTKIHQYPLGPQHTDRFRPRPQQLLRQLPKIHFPEPLRVVDAQIRSSWILLR